jgi:hypothetical protein
MRKCDILNLIHKFSYLYIDDFAAALILLYGKDIYEAVTGGTPAGIVCNSLHICVNVTHVATQNSAPNASPASSPEENGVACFLCELVMEQINHNNYNLTYPEFQQEMENACAKFPSLAKECDGKPWPSSFVVFEAWTILSRRQVPL